MNSKTSILAGIIILVGLIGGTVYLMNKNNQANNSDNSSNPANNESEQNDNSATESFSLAEISKHNQADDCYLAIRGKVYDVTDFVSFHPGGPAIIEGCGKDATTLFETRPMGSGTPHSPKAETTLGQYEIGVLE